ncbi:MAG: hypothetical protein Q8P31_07475 [Bacillota bacterium]|nr:hypothetical protein [Bacillota bacterium]
MLIPITFVALMGALYLYTPPTRSGRRGGRSMTVFAGVLVAAILVYISLTERDWWSIPLQIEAAAVLVKAIVNSRVTSEEKEERKEKEWVRPSGRRSDP